MTYNVFDGTLNLTQQSLSEFVYLPVNSEANCGFQLARLHGLFCAESWSRGKH